MKIKKILAGMTSAVIAASMMTMAASAATEPTAKKPITLSAAAEETKAIKIPLKEIWPEDQSAKLTNVKMKLATPKAIEAGWIGGGGSFGFNTGDTTDWLQEDTKHVGENDGRENLGDTDGDGYDNYDRDLILSDVTWEESWDFNYEANADIEDESKIAQFGWWWGAGDELEILEWTFTFSDGTVNSYVSADAWDQYEKDVALEAYEDIAEGAADNVDKATDDLNDAIANAETVAELEDAIKVAESALAKADRETEDAFDTAAEVVGVNDEELNKMADAYEEHAEKLEEAIEAAKKIVEKMKREAAAAEALEELQDKLDDANIEGVVSDMEAAAKALENVADVLDAAAEAADKIDGLKDALAKAQEAFDALQEGDDADTEAFEAAKKAIGDAAADLAAAEDALNAARAKYDAATQAELDELNEKIKALEEGAEKDAKTIADLEKENDLLDGQVEQLTKDKEDAAAFINEKQAKIDELEAQVEDLKKQLEEAKANNADPEEIQKLKDEIAAKDAEIADLKKQLDDANAAKEAAQKEADDAKKAAEEAKKGSNPGTGAAAFAVAGLALAGAAFVVTKKRK